jgi:hypothetical protein
MEKENGRRLLRPREVKPQNPASHPIERTHEFLVSVEPTEEKNHGTGDNRGNGGRNLCYLRWLLFERIFHRNNLPRSNIPR